MILDRLSVFFLLNIYTDLKIASLTFTYFHLLFNETMSAVTSLEDVNLYSIEIFIMKRKVPVYIVSDFILGQFELLVSSFIGRI